MPELPDVELRRRYLDATAVGRRVEHAGVPDSKLLLVSADHLRRELSGRRVTGSHRHGKHLLARLGDGPWLVLHFGMTGWLEAFGDLDDEPGHTWLRLDLDDRRHLAYVCPRRFGEIDLARDLDGYLAGRGLGPDALAVDEEGFLDRLADRRGAVKPTLMNQAVVAGLGNVWVDEILFQHGLHPATPLPELDGDERRDLVGDVRRVLTDGIECDADPDRIPGDWLLPHREDGATCPRCGGTIVRLKISGRVGYLCPDHQRR